MSRRAPLALDRTPDHRHGDTPDAGLGPWMSVEDIRADEGLPFRHQTAKWVRQHVAPKHRRKLGRLLLWRRQHVYDFAAEWDRSQEQGAA